MKHKFSMTWCGWIIERRGEEETRMRSKSFIDTRENAQVRCSQNNTTTHISSSSRRRWTFHAASFSRLAALNLALLCDDDDDHHHGIEGGSEREGSIRRDVCDDENGFLSSCELKLNWKRGKIYDELMWAKSQNWSLLFIQLESQFFLYSVRDLSYIEETMRFQHFGKISALFFFGWNDTISGLVEVSVRASDFMRSLRCSVFVIWSELRLCRAELL